MIVLEITQDKANELRTNLIVVCTYKTKLGVDVLGIDIQYKNQYPEFAEIEVLDPNNIWHEEDKLICIKQTQEGFNWTALNMDALVTYRKVNDIQTHQYNGGFYFYVNFLLPEHKLLFENESRLGITIIEN